jgi:hypothetical protein
MKRISFLSGAALLSSLLGSLAAEFRFSNHTFTLPEGFELELVAGPPLVDRPILADFDEQGRLYVADSSGSNDKVEKQLEERPHRIVRLEDTNGDGIFDQSIVFADKMMFPEGTLWFDGSLYVSAPPSIWKLTDTDGDGVADRREEWFQGKTLTGCANDLHGPYLGPDGWIYWCKGAFARQTHERPGQKPISDSAAHIFRSRPDGSGLDSVISGGMDNPVEIAFTPEGDAIFTTTFYTNPEGGRRDALVHAVYGGVYPKVHGVIEGLIPADWRSIGPKSSGRNSKATCSRPCLTCAGFSVTSSNRGEPLSAPWMKISSSRTTTIFTPPTSWRMPMEACS